MSVTEGTDATFTLTSAIPLTTIFTPPSENCTAASAYLSTTWAGDQWAYQLDWGITMPSCYPKSYKECQYSSKQWYSPGVCPYLYEWVATSVVRPVDGPGTTLAACCPPGVHNVGLSIWSSCVQVLTTSVSDLSFENTKGEPTPTTAFANAIYVAWQESDLPLFTPASAPILALINAGATISTESTTRTTTSSSSPSTTSSSSPEPTSSAAHPTSLPSSRLTSGAAAGIGVGATAGLILIVGGLWFCLRRYRINVSKRGVQDGQPPVVSEPAKYPPQQLDQWSGAYELLGSTRQPQELNAPRPLIEI